MLVIIGQIYCFITTAHSFWFFILRIQVALERMNLVLRNVDEVSSLSSYSHSDLEIGSAVDT